MDAVKIEYEITESGWFMGTSHQAGDRVWLHPRQAEHDLHRLKPVAAAVAPAPKAKKTSTPAE